ncbi:MAG: hypothetical protein GXP55_15620 [Deltaproteobacteria bacterium]|nr:hypothetical protein [Deltaproteobacteria bacterium]
MAPAGRENASAQGLHVPMVVEVSPTHVSSGLTQPEGADRPQDCAAIGKGTQVREKPHASPSRQPPGKQLPPTAARGWHCPGQAVPVAQ